MADLSPEPAAPPRQGQRPLLRRRQRQIWRRLHLALGLSAGLVLVVVGLSGSLLVFKHDLDRMLNPGLLQARSPGLELVPADIVALTQARLHSEAETADWQLGWLALPRGQGDVYRFHTGPPGAPFAWMYSIDPGSGEVLGRRAAESGAVYVLFRLHERLLLGRMGRDLLALLGLVMLVSLATGLWLWWPGRGGWRRAPGWRGRLGAGGWHRRVGLYGLPALALLIVTGILLAAPQYSRPVVDAVSPLQTPLRSLASEPVGVMEDIGLDAALVIAQRALPGAQVTGLGLPRGERGVYWFALADPQHPLRHARRASVWVDRYSGEVLAARGWEQLGSGDRFLEWLLPLHNGSAFGLPGRIAVAAFGLLPLLLALTGWRIWRQRRRPG